MSSTGSVAQTDELIRLKKALESNLSDANNLELLAQLAEQQVDRAALAKTKIGVSISRLRSSPNPEVAARAKRLVDSWKRLLAADNPAAKFKTTRHSSIATTGKQGTGNNNNGSSHRHNVTNTTNEVSSPPDSNHDFCKDATDRSDHRRQQLGDAKPPQVSEALELTIASPPRDGKPELQSGSISRVAVLAGAAETTEADDDMGAENVPASASNAANDGAAASPAATNILCPVDNTAKMAESPPKPSFSQQNNSLVIGSCTPSSYAERNLSYRGPKTLDIKRDKAREIVFRAFLEGLPEDQPLDEDGLNSVGQLTAAIEDALWERFMTCTPLNFKEYQAQLRSIRSNFADKKNPELNVRVFVGSITPTQLAGMLSTEMASDVKKKEREKTKQDALEACQSDWDLRNVKRAAGQFPCGKCKSSNTTYFQLQTRSSDEPMTTFVSCLDCGHRWKF